MFMMSNLVGILYLSQNQTFYFTKVIFIILFIGMLNKWVTVYSIRLLHFLRDFIFTTNHTYDGVIFLRLLGDKKCPVCINICRYKLFVLIHFSFGRTQLKANFVICLYA